MKYIYFNNFEMKCIFQNDITDKIEHNANSAMLFRFDRTHENSCSRHLVISYISFWSPKFIKNRNHSAKLITAPCEY